MFNTFIMFICLFSFYYVILVLSAQNIQYCSHKRFRKIYTHIYISTYVYEMFNTFIMLFNMFICLFIFIFLCNFNFECI